MNSDSYKVLPRLVTCPKGMKSLASTSTVQRKRLLPPNPSSFVCGGLSHHALRCLEDFPVLVEEQGSSIYCPWLFENLPPGKQ